MLLCLRFYSTGFRMLALNEQAIVGHQSLLVACSSNLLHLLLTLILACA